MKCENCNKEFKNQQGLIYHLCVQHRHINQKCYDFYIFKYGSEDNFPWKIKNTEFKICECCFKEFKREFSLQMHLMTGKKYNSKCYQFYLEKYKSEDDFPTRKYSASKLQNYQVCECCHKKYKRVYHHIKTYSPNCYQFYIQKYGNDNNFPDETRGEKLKPCPDCGKMIGESKKWCINCYRKNHHLQNNPEAIQKIKKSLKKFYSNPINRKMNRDAQKKSFKEKPWLAENQKQYMLSGGAIKALCGNTNCSKPQIEFFNLIKQFFLDAVLNYPLYEINVLLDIAVPSLKIDFEYDGSYWHQDQKYDDERDNKINEMG